MTDSQLQNRLRVRNPTTLQWTNGFCGTRLESSMLKTVRLYAAAVLGSALLIATAPTMAETPPACRAADFATAVDKSGATLRAFTLDAQPKLQERMRRYSEVKKLDTADYEAAALDAIGDDKLTALDEKSANMLLRIDSLGRVPDGQEPDCSKLNDIASLSRELLAVMKEKSDYMLARLDAKIADAGGSAKPVAEAKPQPAPPTKPAEKPATEKALAEKPRTAQAEPQKTKPAEPEKPKSQANDAYVPPGAPPPGADAQVAQAPPVVVTQGDDGYSIDEIREATRGFFGTVSTSLASVLEHAFKTTGRPTAYVLGTEGGGAFFAGLRFGEGTLFMRNQSGTRPVYWHGPSLGTDFGASGSRTMFLIYKLQQPEALFRPFTGVDGSAYFVGGVGVTLLKGGEVIMAPIRSGLGLRLGANIGYVRFSPQPTWNPF